MAANTTTSNPRVSESEKLTINLGYVDLGQIDLLVAEGFYANRSDFIRTAIRNHLRSHADAVQQVVARKMLVLGMQHFSQADLMRVHAAGEKLQIRVLGLASIAQDVPAQLAAETIESITVLGALQASPPFVPLWPAALPENHSMKQLFQDMLGEATRLTRTGNLLEATALIQRTLRGQSAPTPHDKPAATSHRDAGWIVDAEARFIDDAPELAVPVGTSQAGTSSDEQWLLGSYCHGGRQLAYRLYVPPGSALEAGPRPLILMLHGCTQGPQDFAAGTRMNDQARSAGVLVLYPEQTQHANSQKCWNWFKAQHQQRAGASPHCWQASRAR